ncbi:alpha/beta-hydrolase [Thelephora ganbajun]|uniref:Alpha/beta-hydrolase n=1 Tax=Thelephora ganbajun TaxID=370292 RepID=A0ACB6Z982_THEGA|nr:alpha/beta-hydrolase [Thelephora ganbajun]
MKFASLLTTISLAASAFAVYVTSADGTKIWAEATGDPDKPAVVFIPGFSCSSLAFSKQWSDPYMTSNLYMVRYDVRGQGISDQPLANTSYVSKPFAEDFKAVIDYFDIGGKRPILAGWSMGGVTAADIATYYGTGLIRGVVLLGSFPHRNMHSQVATQWILNFIPRLLDYSLAKFGPTAKEFAESCVAFGDQLDQTTKYSWMGAVAGQNPDVRLWSIPHTQNETALMNARLTLPYLVLHGKLDKHVDGVKLRAYMDKWFGNFVFRLWDNVGHASFWDAPEDANKEIVAFARRLRRGWAILSDSPDGLIFSPDVDGTSDAPPSS